MIRWPIRLWRWNYGLWNHMPWNYEHKPLILGHKILPMTMNISYDYERCLWLWTSPKTVIHWTVRTIAYDYEHRLRLWFIELWGLLPMTMNISYDYERCLWLWTSPMTVIRWTVRIIAYDYGYKIIIYAHDIVVIKPCCLTNWHYFGSRPDFLFSLFLVIFGFRPWEFTY